MKRPGPPRAGLPRPGLARAGPPRPGVPRAGLTRAGLTGLALGLAGLVLVQVAIVAFLSTPLAVPDLVIVTVLAVAHAHGSLVGGLAGAWAGLLMDLVPPATGPLGGWMLVLCAAGAVVGRVADFNRPGPFGSMLLLSVGTGLAVLARTGVLWFAGAPVGSDALVLAGASAMYALLLAPVALLLASRRTERSTAPVRVVPAEVVAP